MANDDSRFGVALHALTLMAQAGAPVTSQFIAASVGSNPAWIRESLGTLRDAGLTRSVRGPGGGLTLARAASEITLGQVWLATSGSDFCPARLASTPSQYCSVGGRIEGHLAALSARMVGALTDELDRTTLADWASSLAAGPAGGD